MMGYQDVGEASPGEIGSARKEAHASEGEYQMC